MFKLNTRERLALWKDFRHSLGSLNELEAIKKTTIFGKTALSLLII